MAKKMLKWAGIAVGLVVLVAVGLVAWLTLTEYKPDAVEELEVGTGLSPAYMYTWKTLTVGDSLTLVSQNTGYAGLGKEADFFMDGGKDVAPTGEQVVTYENGIVQQLQAQDADVYFLQEVDTDSSRTGGSNQAVWYHGILNNDEFGPYCWMYALNYSCDFVPYPLPPIGKVHSGLQTLSRFSVAGAQRIALPCPFSWLVSAANLKRCLLVSYVPLDDSDKELVLVNLHLEAYDDGEGKAAQTKVLMDFLTSEYERGNYVIAGGDFNQTFPGALDAFPIKDPSLWTPGVLEEDILPEGWRFACDLSAPTCRLLNQPYDPDSGDTQFYVIDGFILSPNVKLDRVETLDRQFQYTDHNPVLIQATLEEEA